MFNSNHRQSMQVQTRCTEVEKIAEGKNGRNAATDSHHNPPTHTRTHTQPHSTTKKTKRNKMTPNLCGSPADVGVNLHQTPTKILRRLRDTAPGVVRERVQTVLDLLVWRLRATTRGETGEGGGWNAVGCDKRRVIVDCKHLKRSADVKGTHPPTHRNYSNQEKRQAYRGSCPRCCRQREARRRS